LIYGLISFIDDGTTFFVISVLTRLLQGPGNSFFALGCFSCLSNLYSEHLTNANGKYKAAYGIGMLLGYLIGTLLFLGGYIFVFAFYGIAVIFTSILAWKGIPKSVDDKPN
jgi:MFS family permease